MMLQITHKDPIHPQKADQQELPTDCPLVLPDDA